MSNLSSIAKVDLVSFPWLSKLAKAGLAKALSRAYVVNHYSILSTVKVNISLSLIFQILKKRMGI